MSKIEVATNRVIKTADKIDKYNKKLQDEFTKVEHSINKLLNNWNSPTTNNAINQFKKIKTKCYDQRYNTINSYVVSLRNTISTDYKSVERKNKKIADSYK